MAQTRRDAWVEVNLGALERNVRLIRQGIAPDKKLMAILKADAYGHGAVMCAPTLEASGISMIGVASIDEALQFRDAGIETPILVIGMVPDWAMRSAIEENIDITIFDRYRLDSLKLIYQETRRPVPIHIKVDTGMHRIGVHWEQAAEFIRHCQSVPFVKVEGVFSHFAATADKRFTQTQIERWHQVLHALDTAPRHLHIANSAGAIHYPQAEGNLVRLGIALFGYDEDASIPLEPTMSVKARIIHLQDVQEGEGVSYGPSFRAPRSGQPIKVATLPLGYADGIPRCLSNKIKGLIRGVEISQVGTITMDQMMFDVSALPTDTPALIGETITLVGEDDGKKITLRDWAKAADTIEYELMCQLRVRLPKTYTR